MPLVNPIEPAMARREPAQVTLSTIGDLSIAVGDSVRRPAGMGRLPVAATIIVSAAVYLLSVAIAARLNLASGVRWTAPLFPSLCASVLFALWRSSAARARSRETELSASRKALDRLAYEASNATNAIRANLIGCQMEADGVYVDAHLREVRAAVERLCRSMQESAGR